MGVKYINPQIFAKHFLEGQTYALELAFAADGNHAEQKLIDPFVLNFITELRTKFLVKDIYPLIHYANNQAELYSNKDRRLKAAQECLRVLKFFPSLNRMEHHWEDLSIEMKKLHDLFPQEIEVTNYSINPENDRRPCIKLLNRVLSSTNTFFVNINTVESIISRYGKRSSSSVQDEVDWKATVHALRIVDEGIYLLTNKKIVLPYEKDYCKYLKSIINREHSISNVRNEILLKLETLNNIVEENPNNIQSSSEELKKELNDFIYRWTHHFYRSFDPGFQWTVMQLYPQVSRGTERNWLHVGSKSAKLSGWDEEVELTGDYDFL